MAERSFSQLPISSSSSSHGGRRSVNTRRGIFPVSEYWIHAIPVIVFLCFFILWCFSNPVSVDMNDGEITSVQLLVEKSMEVRNESHVSLAIRTPSAVSPVSADQNLTVVAHHHHNVTKSHNATKTHKATKSHKAPPKKSHKGSKSQKATKSHNTTKSAVKKAKDPLAA